MPAQVFLQGLGLSGYRSFGPNPQRMGPFGSVNLFAGANNCGKSNILRILQEHLPYIAGNSQFSAQQRTPGEFDRPAGLSCDFRLAIPVNRSPDAIKKKFKELNTQQVKTLSEILANEAFTPDNMYSWINVFISPINGEVRSGAILERSELAAIVEAAKQCPG